MKTDQNSWKSMMSKNIVNDGSVQIIALVEMVPINMCPKKHRRRIATKIWPSLQSNAHHMILWFTTGLPFSSASNCWNLEISDLEISGAVCFSYICTQNIIINYNDDDNDEDDDDQDEDDKSWEDNGETLWVGGASERGPRLIDFRLSSVRSPQSTTALLLSSAHSLLLKILDYCCLLQDMRSVPVSTLSLLSSFYWNGFSSYNTRVLWLQQ